MRSETHSPFDLADPAGSVRRWAEGAARQHLPRLFCGPPPAALYCMPERHGIRVVALRTAEISDEERLCVLRFRLAQYALVGYIDPELIAARNLTHEDPTVLAADDIHILAGSTDSGEIIGYSILCFLPAARPGATLRDRDRPLLSAEQAAGWGVFNRLQILPDLPLGRIVEGGRFVKNAALGALDERGIRAPVEVALAIGQLLLGPLRDAIGAVVGETEERGLRRNVELFNGALVVLPAVVPLVDPDDLLYPARTGRHFMPCALNPADIVAQIPRLRQVEAALERPGEDAVWALLELKQAIAPAASSFLPPGGLPALATARVCDPATSLEERRRLRALGEWLSQTALFATLSEAEAAVVAALGQVRETGAGALLTTSDRGEAGLGLLCTGAAVLTSCQPAGPPGQPAGPPADGVAIGPGQPFRLGGPAGRGGEVAVTATRDLTWIEWDAATCATYLWTLPDLRDQLRVQRDNATSITGIGVLGREAIGSGPEVAA